MSDTEKKQQQQKPRTVPCPLVEGEDCDDPNCSVTRCEKKVQRELEFLKSKEAHGLYRGARLPKTKI